MTSPMTDPLKAVPRSPRMFWSRPFPISLRLLMAVNLPLGLALVFLLSVEYQREMSAALNDARDGVREEAITIHGALSHLEGHSTAAVQEYISQVCTEMQAAHATDHHIHIQIHQGSTSIQAGQIPQGDSPSAADEALTTAFHTGQSTLELDRTLFVIGGVEDRGIVVIVSENAHKLQQVVRQKLIVQLGTLALLGAIAAVIVNIVVYRVVTRPLRLMTQTVDVIARGQFGGQIQTSHTRELAELATSVNLMSLALDEVEQQRHREMKSARQIQQHLLPTESPIAGLEVCHEYQPADDVGGDYYDFIHLKTGAWLLVIADVAGHGVPSAMAAALLKALLLCASDQHDTPGGILRQINKRFSTLLPAGRFATMLLAIWHPQARRLVYVNAGHPPGLVWNPRDGFRELATTGMPVGILSDTTFETKELVLTNEDRMVWYTDGLLEAFSEEGEMYGKARLRQTIVEHGTGPLKQLQAETLRAVRDFAGDRSFADDLTLLVFGQAATESPRRGEGQPVSEVTLHSPTRP